MRRESEDGDLRQRVAFLLEAIRHLVREPLAERIHFGRRLADQVLLAVGDLEGRAPHLAPPFLGEIAEILHEAENEVRLCEEQIDGIVELQFVVQFLQPVLHFNRMGTRASGGRAS